MYIHVYARHKHDILKHAANNAEGDSLLHVHLQFIRKVRLDWHTVRMSVPRSAGTERHVEGSFVQAAQERTEEAVVFREFLESF